MFLFGAGVYDYIVQIDKDVRQIELTETILHQLLEGAWHIAQAVCHSQKLIDIHTAYHEGGVLVRLLCHLHLPEAALETHTGELAGSHHTLHGLLHTGQGKCVLLSFSVQAAEVDAEAECAILHPNQYDDVAP